MLCSKSQITVSFYLFFSIENSEQAVTNFEWDKLHQTFTFMIQFSRKIYLHFDDEMKRHMYTMKNLIKALKIHINTTEKFVMNQKE